MPRTPHPPYNFVVSLTLICHVLDVAPAVDTVDAEAAAHTMADGLHGSHFALELPLYPADNADGQVRKGITRLRCPGPHCDT